MAEPLAAMSRHYNEVRAYVLRDLQNLDAWIAKHDFDFITRLDFDLPCRPLEPGSCRSLHFSER